MPRLPRRTSRAGPHQASRTADSRCRAGCCKILYIASLVQPARHTRRGPVFFCPPAQNHPRGSPRRIGDVLLTTPLVRSLKARWPEAQIDMLVFRGTEGVLEHNPDVRRVIVVAQRAGFRERLRDALSMWRRYDLACAALSSDRPRFYSWFAGRKRVGLVDPNRVTWLTRMMLNGIAINHHESAHTVVSTLALAP